MEWTAPHPRRTPSAIEIATNKARIKDIDAEIIGIEAQIQQLQEFRDQLLLECLNRASFIAPFQRLPTEILCHIAIAHHDLGGDRSTLINLCSSMRDTFIGLKMLWSTVYLAERGQHVGWKRLSKAAIICRDSDYLELVLSRAAPIPLTLLSLHPEALCKFGQVLMPFSTHIKTFGVNDRAVGLFRSPITALTPLHLSSVTELQIELVYLPYVEHGIDVMDMVESSSENPLKLKLGFSYQEGYHLLEHPLLSRVTRLNIDDRTHEGPPENVGWAPMPQLGELAITSPSSLITFNSAPNLRSLEISGNGKNLPVSNIPSGISSLVISNITLISDTTAPHVFPNLTQLKVVAASNSPTDPASIAAPQLTEFSISCQEGNIENVVSAFDIFLKETTSLRRLHLSHVEISAQDSAYLMAQDNLECLHVDFSNIPKEFLTSLFAPDGSNKDRFPNLSELSLKQAKVTNGVYAWEQLAGDCALTRPGLEVVGSTFLFPFRNSLLRTNRGILPTTPPSTHGH